MAARGHNVALISTDPAHSLGDAIDMNLAGGNLMDCPLIGVPPNTGSLSVLEVDPSQSINQFKGVVDKLIGGGGGDGDDKSRADVRNTLKELEEVFDTLPAGTDEVVALAKVIHLVKKGGYDRIVIDTAPTGHTLRMLSTPGFLAELIDRLLAIADKVNSNVAVKLLVAGSAKRDEIETAAITAKSTLLSFQMQMYDLEDLFADPFQTEFIIVTVPTELAVRESTRLLNDLTFEDPDMPIKVRNIVVNQVLKDDGSDAKTFLSHVHDGQMTSIEDLQTFTSQLVQPPRITTVPYIDTEPRGVFGLNILADELLRE
jgi:arsenite/tail-anchored protein-transporting ATPase